MPDRGSVISFAYGRVSSRAGSDGTQPGSGISRQEKSIEIQDQQFQDYIRTARIPEESFGPFNGGGRRENIFMERHSGFAKKGDIRKRPEGARLWAAIVAAREQFPLAQINLIFPKVDRIGRDQLETLILRRDLESLRVRTHIILEGGEAFDCDSMAGKLFLSFLSWAAENEVKNTQTRILTALDHKRASGELLNGGSTHCVPPYGWDAVPTGEVRRNKGGKDVVIYRLAPNAREQKWIHHMVRLREAGWGWRAIATDLNKKGVPTKRGVVKIKMNGREMKTSGQWRFGTVAKVLNNKTTQAWLNPNLNLAA